MNAPQFRYIWLCADDYGISPAVNEAIRELISLRRINATSVMVVAPSFSRVEAAALTTAAGTDGAIGLHLTLTAPFKPLDAAFTPLSNDEFPSLAMMAGRALLRSLDRPSLTREIAMQFAAFHAAFGRPPDYVDGHHHIHVFPQIGETVLRLVKDAAPRAWVRQCGRVGPVHRRLSDPKALVLDRLSARFRHLAVRAGVRTNPAFAGTYAFTAGADFARLFPTFLSGMPNNGVVMCHPGKVDAELERLDPLTDLREREYAYFLEDAFPQVLAAQLVGLQSSAGGHQ